MKKGIFSLTLLLSLTFGLWAQNNNDRIATKSSSTKDVTISENDILYWVGSGSNHAICVVGWDDEGEALAWGFRWDGSDLVVKDMLDAIDEADSRFSYSFGGGLVLTMSYNDGTTIYNGTDDWWCYYEDGEWAMMGVADQVLLSGSVYEWSDDCSFSITTFTAVTDPNGPIITDATIDADDIRYWVGEGSNEVVFAVNWCSPDTALAWGYRFDSDSVTLQQIMNAIDTADGRFAFQAGNWGISDIFLTLDNDTLHLSDPYSYWWTNVNGTSAAFSYDMLYLHHGDFVKWGEAACGNALAYDEWGYPSDLAWTTAITPIDPYTEPEHLFDGAVGTEGCQAISHTDPSIVGWASACQLVRGRQNIADEQSPEVTFGDESCAVGPVVESGNMNVVSLGDGGYATLTFPGVIYNGEGYDFCVFENSFNDEFLELAFVEVSSDGINFFRFPATSLTQTEVQTGANGATDPTMIHNLAGKYRSLWGTPFDLEELAGTPGLDINAITHVRIIDVVGSIDPQYGNTDSEGRLINDPYPTRSYSGGFDLDGVGVMHINTVGIDQAEAAAFQMYPNPANSCLYVNTAADIDVITIYDMTGRIVLQKQINSGASQLSISNLANGVYMVRMGTHTEKLVVRH